MHYCHVIIRNNELRHLTIEEERNNVQAAQWTSNSIYSSVTLWTKIPEEIKKHNKIWKKSSTQTTIMINTSKSCIKNDAKKSSQYQWLRTTSIVTKTPICKRLGSAWLQAWLIRRAYNRSIKVEGSIQWGHRNMACNTCRGTWWGFP